MLGERLWLPRKNSVGLLRSDGLADILFLLQIPDLNQFGNVPLGMAPSEEGIHRTNVVVHRSWLKLGGCQLHNSPFKRIANGLGIQRHTVTTCPEITE